MAAIHAECFPPAGQWSAAVMELQLGLPGAFGWIDPAGGLVLARVAADESEILTLGVVPDARGRGLGGALLRRAMKTARVRGADCTLLEVEEGNAAARALYAGAGFVAVGRRRGYYAGGADALILRATLCG